MTIRGTIEQILPVESGTSKAGKEWKKQNVILNTGGEYAKQVCIGLFNGAIEKCAFALNAEYDVEISLESHEYNGRWYTSVNGRSATPLDAVQPQPSEPQSALQSLGIDPNKSYAKPLSPSAAEASEDLPF